MAFLELFIVALIPVLKTLIVTAVGLFLALERVDILGHTARHSLNKLVFFVFTPGLVASSLANTITLSSLMKLWFMPVNILLTFMIGSALGWILAKITRTPKHLHGLVIGCCSAGNLGNLLLIIIPAVCEESNSPFGDASTCSTNGQAYASLSMAIGAVYIWIYIYNVIRACMVQNIPTDEIHHSGEGSQIEQDSVREALISKDSFNSEDYESQAAAPLLGYQDIEKVTTTKKIKQLLKTFAQKVNLKMLFAPSTIATIVGLSIGGITPLRNLFVGDNSVLRVVDSSAVMIGDAAIPAMTLIVGANLLRGLKRSGVGIWLVIGILTVRYIVLPLLGIVIVRIAHHFGCVGSDSLYQFVLLLQYALPPAMALGTITQLFEVGETECSVIMLWNYAVAALALTLWTTYYLWILS